MNFSFLVLFWITAAMSNETTLTVEISNIKATKGTIRMGVYKKGSSLSGNPDYPHILPLSGRSADTERVTFRLPPGRYAFAAYHDANNNEKLDKNLVGYPKEPFGFSNNFRPVLSAPSFEDCAFDLAEGGTTIKVKLK
ncbi:MAG: DUF2141 domain-containing protein [Runella slithyformis]|nr:MAG: DUF2141 domain-containing protein [Runella slithyformis]TAE96870.1 MAG: DUF2141 domain-containing protein [Runella slithyformis]TAF29582.1 MAG: DUF2141 domain-containing protein [Runella slithyformis]TAF48416.1 MAG: DUF2141 domain-containing protein [Runella slithyformis]TAF83025.1 MAG: DUF2141 domain-containing protein [Runella slithyformis]